MTKVTWRNYFTVFVYFQQTAKIFPTNFMSAILSAKYLAVYTKNFFAIVKIKTAKVYPTLSLYPMNGETFLPCNF